MPRAHSDSGRIELRLRPEDKALLTRAATLERLDLTGYILRNLLPQAAAVIAREEHLQLSERDSLPGSLNCSRIHRPHPRASCARPKPVSRSNDGFDLGGSPSRKAARPCGIRLR
jgi:hypothetical protein